MSMCNTVAVRTIFSEIIRRAVVKSYANSENHVGVMHGHIGFISAMHSQHS